MSQPLISIIIPIYGVERHLDQCVKSVLSQTYKNLEIILVDDGSKDNCPIMCDNWAEKDDRIIVLHKKNGGLSDARNAGIAVAKGDFIGFVDGDDYISKDMYELLFEDLLKNGSDISACGIEQFWENGDRKQFTANGSYVFNTDEAMRALLDESFIKQPVWYKLYRREIIKDLLFPIGKLHEDVLWSYKAIGNAKKFSLFDKPCYFYRQQEQSIMGSTFSLKRLDAVEAKEEVLDFIKRNFPQFIDLAKSNLWFSSLYNLQRVLNELDKANRKIGVDYIKGVFKKYKIHFSDLKHAKTKQRLWLSLLCVSPVLTARLRNLLKIGL